MVDKMPQWVSFIAQSLGSANSDLIDELVRRENKLGITTWAKPTFIPEEDGGRHIFVVDEIPSADHRMQVPLYQLFHDKRVGEHRLPRLSWLYGAGNIDGDNATLYDMQGPLLSRMVVMRLRPNAADWDLWAEENGVAPEVRAFIRIYPEFLDASLMEFKDRDQRISPNPRAWGQAISNYIKTFGFQDDVISKAFIAGKVGIATAENFITTMKEMLEIPSPQQMFAYYKRAKETKRPEEFTRHIPAKLSALYGVASALSRTCSNSQEFSDAIGMLTMLCAVKDNLPRADVRVMGVSMLLREISKQKLRPEVARSAEWKQYSKEQNVEELVTFHEG